MASKYDFESFCDSLAEIGASMMGKTLPPEVQESVGYKSAPMLPVNGWQKVATKVVKLEDAVLLLHLFNAYVMHRSLFASMTQTVTETVEFCETLAKSNAQTWLAKSFLKKLLSSETFELLNQAAGVFTTWVNQLARVADAVTQQREIQLKIRRQGRAIRQDLLESYLNFGKQPHSRHREPVYTRR